MWMLLSCAGWGKNKLSKQEKNNRHYQLRRVLRIERLRQITFLAWVGSGRRTTRRIPILDSSTDQLFCLVLFLPKRKNYSWPHSSLAALIFCPSHSSWKQFGATWLAWNANLPLWRLSFATDVSHSPMNGDPLRVFSNGLARWHGGEFPVHWREGRRFDQKCKKITFVPMKVLLVVRQFLENQLYRMECSSNVD